MPVCEPTGRQVPQLLEADGELLRLTPFGQLQTTQELLGQVAAHAITEDGDLGVDVHACFEGLPGFSLTIEAPIAGSYPDDAVTVEEHFLPGKPGEEVDSPRRVDPLRQPAHEGIQRDDVVAVIAQRRRNDRQCDGGAACQEVDLLAGLRQSRRASVVRFDVRKEVAERRRVEHRAGQRMCARLASLLQDGD